MPKRTDIRKVLIIGAGPIIIGQACEFDYSGTQACKALKEEGYEVVLVNSNPATIMTDPSLADRTYIEPLTIEAVSRIIETERPDALLPTVGGQTALNLAMDLHGQGVLDTYNVEMIGANAAAIEKAEAREAFKAAMEKLNLEMPRSFVAVTLEEVKARAKELGFPCVVRPAFTLGGTGGGIAQNEAELESICAEGLRSSLISEVLVEESILGWKEYEMEVMRDRNDNVVIVCSIENLDPMGIHTGDSITVAPSQTLSDREYQMMRNASVDIIREIGVDTGGSNIQFAMNPENGRMTVIEMNPRVSRSSALASKATGFPIAKLAAKLAVGYTLDELQNDITKKTPACFEPTLDYCVVKFPRFNFDKFPATPNLLGTSMKSVGEAMSIGRTFKEAFQKGLRSLENKRFGFGFDGKDYASVSDEDVVAVLSSHHPERIFYLQEALRRGFSIEDIHGFSKIDPWFLHQLKDIVTFAENGVSREPESLRRAKELGFSDRQLAVLLGAGSESDVRAWRKEAGVSPTYSLVDTCAAEFEAYTPYYYSTYETSDESRQTETEKVMILGGGPNRIGQGIEFDYCCVHASMAIRNMGYESIMVNSNPETVSTDFDSSDRLYFEPLTLEDVLNIYESEKPKGVVIQFGGQTPLNLAVKLEEHGVPILGTSSDSIDRAEDRERFQTLLEGLGLKQPPNGTVSSSAEARDVAAVIGYPVVVRPSYVLGGASMRIVWNDDQLDAYMDRAIDVSPEHPILIDKYLVQAVEIDVDCLSDGSESVVAGIMEHIEEAGIHSGDSACSLPPYTLPEPVVQEIREATHALAKELKIIGLMNIQFAYKDGELFVLEVNPRGSRTVPFVSKATGVSWAKLAMKVMLGESIQSLGVREARPEHYAVKEAVFPFNKFPGVDVLLGPEMKSTGEVMGIDASFDQAYLKSQYAAGQTLPKEGLVFVSVQDRDKELVLPGVKRLVEMGFSIVSTAGTAVHLEAHGVPCQTVNKLKEGSPHVIDRMDANEIVWIVNTANLDNPFFEDEVKIRQAALSHNLPIVQTIRAFEASVEAIAIALASDGVSVKPIQDYIGVGEIA